MDKAAGIISLIFIVSFLSGCAGTTPPTIYLPQEEQQVKSFYRNGLPIGAINADSVVMMVSMEPTSVSGTKYMRLWLLYENKSSTPFLLEPLKAVQLTVLGTKKSYYGIVPDSPSKILASIENEKAAHLISQAIGGTLQALTTKPTTVTNQNGEELTVNDKQEKVHAVTNETQANMASTALYYDIFKNSVNSGIMRRNTIFPGESVNGYIYFPLPVLSSFDAITPSKYNYKLQFSTPNWDKTVEFAPTLGE